MNEKDLLIAISKSDGWRDIHEEDGTLLDGAFKGILVGKYRAHNYEQAISNYTGSLDPISIAAKRMPLTKRGDYAPILREIVMRDHNEEMKDLDSGIVIDLFFYEAIPFQKCEAYAKAMGIWVECETKGAQ